ncbi:Protein of unknown function [Leuconostoc citreum]|nr:Protein of unknown function [Leuconostoc citreum]
MALLGSCLATKNMAISTLKNNLAGNQRL